MGTATPGGGSASAYTGAMAAALVAMVARLTIGKKKYADVQAEMETIMEQAERLRGELTVDVVRDATAFERLMAAYQLPKGTEKEGVVRVEAIEEATLEATYIPLEVADKSLKVLELASQVVEAGNINAISDGATGVGLALAAIKGASLNVRLNAADLKDRRKALELMGRMDAIEDIAAELDTQINSTLSERGGLPLE